MKQCLLIAFLFGMSAVAAAQDLRCRYGFSYEISNSAHWGKDKPVITGVYPYSPAARAEIKPYDIIEAVDGKPVTEDVLDDIHLFLDAEGKETVELTVKNFGGQTRKVKISRECKNAESLPEEQLADAFAMYAVEYTHDRLFVCPFTTVQSKTPVDFSTFATFAFSGADDGQPKQAEKIRSLIKDELSAKGLVYNAENPDLIVHINYSFNKNPRYAPKNKTPKEEEYVYRYHIARDKMEKMPLLPPNTIESEAEYALALGIRLEDGKSGHDAVWECEVHEWLYKPYPLENFASVHVPLMLMQFPYMKYGRNVQYRLSKKKYGYTGINYRIDDLSEVASVDFGSPAAKAGIRRSDMIDAIDDKRMDRSPQQFTAAYHQFIANTMSLRDQSTCFVDARGFTGCMYWDEQKYPLISNEFNKKKYLTAFSYLYRYAPFVDPSGKTACSFKLRRGDEKWEFIVQPEIRTEITLVIE